MARGGKRPGAGRKKGSGTGRTRKTNALAVKAAGEGPMPLEVLLSVMRAYYEAGNNQLAAEVARAAAPYVHPRLSAVAVSGGDSPVRLEYVVEIVEVPATEVESNGEVR